MAQSTPSLYALDPALPVLLRPDGAVQVGWSPRRAVLIRPPRGLTAVGLATVLRTMHSPVPMSELQRQADRHGALSAGELDDLVAQLVKAGVATHGRRQRPARSASIRVHGRGPLSELLVEGLRCSGARVKQTSQPHAAVTAADVDVDLMVLSDNLITDPRMLRDLHSQGVAHLAVRVRDGIGLVGPLVIPGVTSCRCSAARHRRRGRPPDPARDGGAGAQPGQPGDRGGPRARRRTTSRAGPGTAAGVEHHAGVRRTCRLDRGAAVAQASTVFVLIAEVARAVR